MKLAPIVLFVYNRPWHAKQTVEALQKNFLVKDSDLIIFSDGAKKPEDQKEIDQVRDYVKTIDGFRSVKIIENERNVGLARSIIAGVTKIINEYGRIIVLEDDIITSRHFLEYMNRGLELYENDDRVISIHSYIYPVKGTLPETFFIKGADCQGWATWKRGWDLFEPDGKKLLKEISDKKLTKKFNFSNSFPYSKMLRAQIAGKNSSWAIRWYASAFLKDKLTLYPRESLVYNTGFDGSGTHGGPGDVFNKTDKVENIKIEVNKIEVKEDLRAKEVIIDFFKTIKEPLTKKIMRKIRELLYPAKKF